MEATLLAVDADPVALGSVERELRDRYTSGYRVICTTSPEEALEVLTRLSEDGEELALALAGQGLPGTTGAELLERVRQLHPHAKRGLLVAWGEWGNRATAKAILDAMALGQIDYFVLRPAVSPDELFHHAISGFLLEWTEAQRIAPQTVRVVGETWSGRGGELRDALQRCAIPHAFYLSGSKEGRGVLAKAGNPTKLPIMVLPGGQVLSDPTNREVADSTGVAISDEGDEFDVVIVGAGPAGLSAAGYGPSEGLSTLVVDEGGIGGQATSSSLIRNYLGFSRGVSGRRLAQQAYEQAWVFGAQFAFMQKVTELRREHDALTIALSDFGRVRTRAVLLAMGATYRRLDVPVLEALNGAGVFYGGATSEAAAMADRDVSVLGGATSAGQAALHLARYARRVTLVARAGALDAGMSHYLVQQVEATPNLRVRLGTEVVGGGGDGWLECLVLRDRANGSPETVDADGLFLLIGARPHTEWLPPEVDRDAQGFVLTGTELPTHAWPLDRSPLLLETSTPRVFAAGDVRSGSVKRVASSVGDGSIAIQLLHRLFAAEGLLPRGRPREPAAASAPPAPAGLGRLG